MVLGEVIGGGEGEALTMGLVVLQEHEERDLSLLTHLVKAL